MYTHAYAFASGGSIWLQKKKKPKIKRNRKARLLLVWWRNIWETIWMRMARCVSHILSQEFNSPTPWRYFCFYAFVVFLFVSYITLARALLRRKCYNTKMLFEITTNECNHHLMVPVTVFWCFWWISWWEITQP